MKAVAFSCAFLSLVLNVSAENQTVQSPIIMEQLMRELPIKGGNWVFRFDRPVFAKVVCTVSAFPDGKTSKVTEFISDRSEREISLFFMASTDRVGDYPRPDIASTREIKVSCQTVRLQMAPGSCIMRTSLAGIHGSKRKARMGSIHRVCR